MTRLLRIPLWLVHQIWARVFPYSFARHMGVQMGRGVRFYGLSPRTLGTEPWLIRLGDHCHITSGCQFITHDGGTLALRWRDPTLELTAPITLGDRVYLGVNTLVLPGVTIGDNVVIGAGSIVTKDIPNDTVAAGIPARPIKPLEEYFEGLQERSLGFGAMSATEKEGALRAHFAEFIAGHNNGDAVPPSNT